MAKQDTIQICKRCIMDTKTDDKITFNENGFCNYCESALKREVSEYFPDESGKNKLDVMLQRLKQDGKGKPYDCLMGLSGGLDSSYLIYLAAVKWNLRILALHVDDGYDTAVSARNLRRLSQLPNVTYIVKKPNASAFNDIVYSYMRAGVPNLCAPQDNITLAYLYACAKENNIRYFLSGGNFALECILQNTHSHENADVRNIRDIHRRYGRESLRGLKFISRIGVMIRNRVYHIMSMRPLNYIDYNRDRALQELTAKIGFEYYGAKHLENDLTAFLQLYWLYTKFGVDKRKSHLSSMILTGQMSRDAALDEVKKPIIESDEQMNRIIDVVLDHVGITKHELETFMKAPTHEHNEFRVSRQNTFFQILNRIKANK